MKFANQIGESILLTYCGVEDKWFLHQFASRHNSNPPLHTVFELVGAVECSDPSRHSPTTVWFYLFVVVGPEIPSSIFAYFQQPLQIPLFGCNRLGVDVNRKVVSNNRESTC